MSKNIQINQKDMEQVVLDEVKAKMDKTVEVVRGDVATISTGKANAGLVEDVRVEAYPGLAMLTIKELGSITATDPHTLTIQIWDRGVVEAVAKAISGAGIGFNPVVDGPLVRINIPPLSQERREDLVKLLRQKLEGGRIMVRQIRGDYMGKIKKALENKEINEDEKEVYEKQVQQFTNNANKAIEKLGQVKESELMTI